MKTIQYAYHLDGYVVSRCGDQLAWPILDFEGIGQGGSDAAGTYGKGNFHGPMKCNLEKVPVYDVGREWDLLVWTRFIPIAEKNKHREFWSLPRLLAEPIFTTVESLCRAHRVTSCFKLPMCVVIHHSTFGDKTVRGLYHYFVRTRKGYTLHDIRAERPKDASLFRIPKRYGGRTDEKVLVAGSTGQ